MRPATNETQRPECYGSLEFGISGDYPIVLVRIDDVDDRGIVRQLLRAHEYWRLKLLAVDLVILNEKETSYIQELQVSLEGMVSTSLAGGRALQESRGRIFVLRADLLTSDERLLLQTAARAVLAARDGSLTEQVMRMRRQEQRTVHPARRQFPGTWLKKPLEAPPWSQWPRRFTEGARIVIVLGKAADAGPVDQRLQQCFGFQVSESGAATPGPSTAAKTSSPPGPTTRCPTFRRGLYIRDRDSGAI
jgi:cyclic beta-1,2-glucan synthetase